MSWEKVDVEGKIMWESLDGERLRDTQNRPTSLFGWEKTDIMGKVMFVSKNGERVFRR